ncbi:MAG: hypothetical protein WD403_01495 [Pirellulales bacterium]
MNTRHYEGDGPDESGHYEPDDCMNADHYKPPPRIVPMATVAWLAAIAPAIAQVRFENELPAPVELAAAEITLDRAAARGHTPPHREDTTEFGAEGHGGPGLGSVAC